MHQADPTQSVRRARLGVSLMFFANGVLFSALLPRYPEFKTSFGLSNAVVDAAQNLQGVLVEHAGGRSIMNSFHAVWSSGAATGGAIGGAAAAAHIAPGPQMVINGIVWSGVAVMACRLASLPSEPGATAHQGQSLPPDPTRLRAGIWRVLGPLVVLAICGTLVEDVANNWGVLYLDRTIGAPTVIAGLTLTVVLAAQFIGRLVGDPLTDRWGRGTVASIGGILITLGAVLIMAATTYPLADTGFALTGFGCATLVPAAFAGAGRIQGLRHGTGIALLGWLMRLGFLITSPSIGWLSQLTNLRVAMLIPATAGVMAALLARRLTHGATP